MDEYGIQDGQQDNSLRSWRDFARECFCFSCEAVNTSGEAVRGLAKSRVEFPRGLRHGRNMVALPRPRSRIPPATQANKITDVLLSKSLVSCIVGVNDFYRSVTICFTVTRAVASNRQKRDSCRSHVYLHYSGRKQVSKTKIIKNL